MVILSDEAASELRELAQHASTLEAILTDVASILDAISAGEMLANLPPEERDANLHNSAVCLLDLAQRRLAEEQAIPGTDLSIKLHVLANDGFERRKAA